MLAASYTREEGTRFSSGLHWTGGTIFADARKTKYAIEKG